MRIYHHHIYSTHVNGRLLCASGARRWFAAHSLSWSEFIKNGIDVKELIALDDIFAQAVIKTAKKGEQI